MISYKFNYKVAKTMEEAFSMLSEAGDGGSFISGGHSLVPAMKLRLAEPETLIDISKIPDMSSISQNGDIISIGGLVTHAEVASSDLIKTNCPGLAECANVIGDTQVRNKGTIGGNIAHADPGSDYPGALIAFNATICLSSANGSREIPANEFFIGLFETAKKEDEIIKEVKFKTCSSSAYIKFPNPASRYAVVGVGVCLEMQNDICQSISIGVTGAADHAYKANKTESILISSELNDENLNSASQLISENHDMMNDLVASKDYREHLCGIILKRTINKAKSRS